MNVWFDNQRSHPLTCNTRDRDSCTWNDSCKGKTDNMSQGKTVNCKGRTVSCRDRSMNCRDSLMSYRDTIMSCRDMIMSCKDKTANYMDSIVNCMDSGKDSSCMCKGTMNCSSHNSKVDWMWQVPGPWGSLDRWDDVCAKWPDLFPIQQDESFLRAHQFGQSEGLVPSSSQPLFCETRHFCVLPHLPSVLEFPWSPSVPE
jgi:hypothetical protein